VHVLTSFCWFPPWWRTISRDATHAALAQQLHTAIPCYVSVPQTTATAAVQNLGEAAAASTLTGQAPVVAAVPQQQQQQQQQQQRQPSSLHQQYLYQVPHAEQTVPQLPKFVRQAEEQQPMPILQALQLVQVRHYMLTLRFCRMHDTQSFSAAFRTPTTDCLLQLLPLQSLVLLQQLTPVAHLHTRTHPSAQMSAAVAKTTPPPPRFTSATATTAVPLCSRVPVPSSLRQ
jgi:hypothetical protein